MSEELIKNRNSGISIVNCLTDIVDKIVISIFNKVTAILGFSENLALVAIGGYGRREISPFSDIDIMFLVRNEERNTVDIVQSILYKLWDNGLNISHSFRIQKDLIKDAMKDLEVRTSLMEGRFIAGGYELFRGFKRDIYPKILYRDKQKLLRDILTDINNRYKKYDNSLHLLEPNIKEGNGGLRDAHSGLWLARAILNVNNIQDYNKIVSQSSYLLFLRAYNFLLKIRVGLHIVSQRKNEILSYEFHQSVSHLLGFKDTERYLAPEIMMRLYYTNIKNIKNIVSIIINMCSKKQSRFSISFSVKRIGNSGFYLSKNKIIVKDEKTLQTPEGMLEAFYIYSITGKDFSFKTKEFIVDKMILVKKIPLSQRVIDLWIKILRGDRVYETLRQMYETRVLDRLIPEFKRLINLVIFEPYHKYTVDEHTLLAIKALESLIQTKDKTLSHIREIFIKSNREIIFLALILHDIGKGLYQKHEKMGYIMIKNIIERFNIGYQDRSKIEFLVKNHTLLAKLALTRDIDSKETISNIVEKIDNIETLDMLYLMTYSDMKATSPSFWTIWKGHLLYIMYLKIKEYIDGIQKQSFIALPNEDIKKFLKNMPRQYLVGNTQDEIFSDYELIQEARIKKLSFQINDRSDGSAMLVVVTYQMPRVFWKIVGILGLRRLNILQARLFSSQDGFVIQKIVISNWKEIYWEGMKYQLLNDFRDIILMDHPLPLGWDKNIMAKSAVFYQKRIEIFVEVDNEISDEYSVLEVYLPDRIGLLYDITVQLFTFDIDITSAIINTEDGLSQDIFYIKHNNLCLNTEMTLKVLNAIQDVGNRQR